MPTVAVVGASTDRSKFGNKAVRAFKQQGFDVYPVNPRGGEIEGLLVYRSLSEIPVKHLDRISVYLPPAVLIDVLDEIAQLQFDQLWLNPGSDSPEVLAKAAELGLDPIQACSIIGVGMSPSDLE